MLRPPCPTCHPPFCPSADSSLSASLCCCSVVAALTGASALGLSALVQDEVSSTGSSGPAPTLGAGQALVTLALIAAVISATLAAVYLRHRSQGVGAPLSLPSFQWPSLRRGPRTHGSGQAGGGAADERSERLLAGGAEDSAAQALRNRPGGHSLL